MIKSIFVDGKNVEGIGQSGANHLIIPLSELDTDLWLKFKSLHLPLGISINCFGDDGCPADPASQDKLFQKIDSALSYQPDEIWLDHFRFDGHWENITNGMIPNVHKSCQCCRNQIREEILKNIAQKIMDSCIGKTKVGYFAVPFKNEEMAELASGLGQDHSIIGRVFDLSSPMLYHRMIDKPTSYISEYVLWLSQKANKSVLPIIQVRDMPDHLKDRLGAKEITTAFNEAAKPPSLGVSIFWWSRLLEKSKIDLIKKLFSGYDANKIFR